MLDRYRPIKAPIVTQHLCAHGSLPRITVQQFPDICRQEAALPPRLLLRIHMHDVWYPAPRTSFLFPSSPHALHSPPCCREELRMRAAALNVETGCCPQREELEEEENTHEKELRRHCHLGRKIMGKRREQSGQHTTIPGSWPKSSSEAGIPNVDCPAMRIVNFCQNFVYEVISRQNLKMFSITIWATSQSW